MVIKLFEIFGSDNVPIENDFAQTVNEGSIIELIAIMKINTCIRILLHVKILQ